MNLNSHIYIAKKITIGLKYRTIIIVGSVFPDFNLKTQPHRTENLLYRIKDNIFHIEKTNNIIEKNFRFGILLHYLCDYFCYAHNYNLDISHGKNHIIYEHKLHEILRKGYQEEVILEEKVDDLIEYIVKMKQKFDSIESDEKRDIRYSFTVCKKVFSKLNEKHE